MQKTDNLANMNENKVCIHMGQFQDSDVLRVSSELDAKQLDLEFDDLIYLSSLNIEGEAAKSRDVITVKVAVKAKLEKKCSRCLELFQEDLDHSFKFREEIGQRMEVDITDHLRESLLLLREQKCLCSDDCDTSKLWNQNN